MNASNRIMANTEKGDRRIVWVSFPLPPFTSFSFSEVVLLQIEGPLNVLARI